MEIKKKKSVVKIHDRGPWLAQSVGPVTLDLRLLKFEPHVDREVRN